MLLGILDVLCTMVAQGEGRGPVLLVGKGQRNIEAPVCLVGKTARREELRVLSVVLVADALEVCNVQDQVVVDPHQVLWLRLLACSRVRTGSVTLSK